MSDPIESTPVKVGYKTTEFWLSLIASLISLLVMSGLIPTTDQAMLQTLGTKLIAGVVAAVSVYKYIQSRTDLKTTGGV